jgi:hypothetical protein
VKPSTAQGEISMKLSKEFLAKEIKAYREIKSKQFPFEKYGGFFAFGNEQFDNNKIGTAPFVHITAGLYCAKSSADELVKNLNMFSKNKNKFVKETINPYAMFSYEAENHECSYTGDYETPHEMVSEIYGQTVADEIMNDKEFMRYLNGDDMTDDLHMEVAL